MLFLFPFEEKKHLFSLHEPGRFILTLGIQIYGPLQSNGICLLDLPFHSHLKPIASTSLVTAFPHVATVPGPVSLPAGWRWEWIRCTATYTAAASPDDVSYSERLGFPKSAGERYPRARTAVAAV